ncbi:ROK family transcriptional regulator [Microbacterium croceum]|uniref:ROK family transcriptional regulator n=1 Tax=Microbacterium croceum TaxID=2851645 RepID=UPI001FFDB37A|nr:ROK family transcriptional regulator [Microbacterium croceum]
MNRIPVTSPAAVAVFRRILTHGPVARVDIARDTGLSAAAVTKAVTPLIAAGFVSESSDPRATATVGRPTSPLAVVPDRAHVIGIKVTADRTYGVRTDLGATVRARADEENAGSSVEAVRDAVVRVVDRLTAGAEGPIGGIGIALSGDVDRAGGRVRDSALLGWQGVPFARMVQEATGIPTLLDNDVRALTTTELLFGAGRDAESFAVVTIGAGTGCGLYLNGRVVQGAFGVAGEIGHLPFAPAHLDCRCGRRGCVEAAASSAAILSLVREGRGQPDLAIGDVFALAHAGDPVARAVFAQAGRAIGTALAAVVNLTGPELVVFAGENVTEYGLYEEQVRAAFAEYAFGAAGDCAIVLRPHAFEDWARGAAACVIEDIASGVAVPAPREESSVSEGA